MNDASRQSLPTEFSSALVRAHRVAADHGWTFSIDGDAAVFTAADGGRSQRVKLNHLVGDIDTTLRVLLVRLSPRGLPSGVPANALHQGFDRYGRHMVEKG